MTPNDPLGLSLRNLSRKTGKEGLFVFFLLLPLVSILLLVAKYVQEISKELCACIRDSFIQQIFTGHLLCARHSSGYHIFKTKSCSPTLSWQEKWFCTHRILHKTLGSHPKSRAPIPASFVKLSLTTEWQSWWNLCSPCLTGHSAGGMNG